MLGGHPPPSAIKGCKKGVPDNPRSPLHAMGYDQGPVQLAQGYEWLLKLAKRGAKMIAVSCSLPHTHTCCLLVVVV